MWRSFFFFAIASERGAEVISRSMLTNWRAREDQWLRSMDKVATIANGVVTTSCREGLLPLIRVASAKGRYFSSVQTVAET